jgi:hypothetical protein
MTGWGDKVQSRTETWGQPVVTLRLTGESQPTEKITLAGARNEHLFLPILLEGASASLKTRVEGLDNGLECKFSRLAAVPPASDGKFPPDALFPLNENFPGLASDPLTLWVSIKIASDCPPGSYPLTLVFTDRQGRVSLPVELKVYRFALPDDLPITVFGGFWHQPTLWSWYDRSLRPVKVRIIKRFYQSLREYKINALGGSYPLPLSLVNSEERIEDFSNYHKLLEYALNELQFKNFQIPKLKDWKSISSPDSTFLQQARIFYPLYGEYLRRHGWENRALNYLVDEPRPGQYEAVVQAFALAKSLVPRVQTLSAGWRPHPEFAKVIDIWAHQAGHFQEVEKEQGRRQGQEAWLYANRLHDIRRPLSNQRLIGWLLYRYQFSGYLLWGVNYWPQDPWTTPPGPQNFYRRGTFYYPHPQTGLPVPTTRLEALRLGFQDFQYLLLLERACRQGLVPPMKQAAVLAQVRRFTENLPTNSFQISMAELEAVRLQIGELLDKSTGLSAGFGKNDRSDAMLACGLQGDIALWEETWQ